MLIDPLTDAVRDGLAGGGEPDVADLFLLDANGHSTKAGSVNPCSLLEHDRLDIQPEVTKTWSRRHLAVNGPTAAIPSWPWTLV